MKRKKDSDHIWHKGTVLSEPDVINGKTTFRSRVDGTEYCCRSNDGHDMLDLVFLNPDDNILLRGKVISDVSEDRLLQISDIRLLL